MEPTATPTLYLYCYDNTEYLHTTYAVIDVTPAWASVMCGLVYQMAALRLPMTTSISTAKATACAAYADGLVYSAGALRRGRKPQYSQKRAPSPPAAGRSSQGDTDTMQEGKRMQQRRAIYGVRRIPRGPGAGERYSHAVMWDSLEGHSVLCLSPAGTDPRREPLFLTCDNADTLRTLAAMFLAQARRLETQAQGD
jgi:hypothetical protein